MRSRQYLHNITSELKYCNDVLADTELVLEMSIHDVTLLRRRKELLESELKVYLKEEGLEYDEWIRDSSEESRSS